MFNTAISILEYRDFIAVKKFTMYNHNMVIMVNALFWRKSVHAHSLSETNYKHCTSRKSYSLQIGKALKEVYLNVNA
mgnify:CR=1 FL=1